MPVVRCACPKCGMQLQLSQELPARVQCPGCATLFTVGPPPAGNAAGQGVRTAAGGRAVAPPAAPPPAPQEPPAPEEPPLIQRRTPRRRAPQQPQRSLLPWLLVGGGALAIAVVVLILVLRGGGSGERPPDSSAAGPSGKPAPPGPGSRRDEAIRRGLAYLRREILQGDPPYYCDDLGGGSKLGVLALAGLTLLECGESPGDAAVQKVAQEVRARALRLNFTYTLALCVLFLDSYHAALGRSADPGDRELIQRLATQMVNSQNVVGGWDYTCEPIPPERHKEVLGALNSGGQVEKRELYTDDNSINQFCTLALWAARKHGVKTDLVLKAIEARYRKNQNPDGSWGYRARDSGRLKDATTCAGLIGLAVGQGVDRDNATAALTVDLPLGPLGVAVEQRPGDVTKDDPQIRKGLAYVSKRVGVNWVVPPALEKKRQEDTQKQMQLYKQWQEAGAEERKKIKERLDPLVQAPVLRGTIIGADAWGDLYFLWSVERVGVAFGLRKIGDKEWYEWGMDIILRSQKEDGSWRDRFPGMCDTCFALLFLKKADVAKDLTRKLRRPVTAPGISSAPPPRQGPGPRPQPAGREPTEA
jgi:hypothetical protein